jgi:hypothetical protein
VDLCHHAPGTRSNRPLAMSRLMLGITAILHCRECRWRWRPWARHPLQSTVPTAASRGLNVSNLVALWAASCAEHVLDLFESAQPDDPRPREAIEHARA